MPGSQPGDRMSDLVKNAVTNGERLIRQDKVNRKLDPLIRMTAQPHGPLCAIEGEGPIAQPIFSQKRQRHFPRFRRRQFVLAIHDLLVVGG
jgi:hypothetical protein